MILKVVLKCVGMASGAPSVTLAGAALMRVLFVNSWDLHMMVLVDSQYRF